MRTSFDVNSPFLFGTVAVIIAFVMVQAVFFLVKAWRRGRELGMSVATLRKTAVSSAVFTIAPATAILLGVVTLAKKLGVPLPWLRLSVIGAITYELSAAEAGANAVGTSIAESSVALTADQYTAIVWVMTLGIMASIALVPILCRKILKGMSSLKNKDKKWGDIFSTALFMGMVSAFLGVIFADVTAGLAGWIPVFVMLASAAVMALCGVLVKKLHWRWLEDYALPFAMIGGMAAAIPITEIVRSIVG